jgi:O-antigen/teichoic acid export membrane protein
MVPQGEQSIVAVSHQEWPLKGRRPTKSTSPRLSLRRNFLWSLAGNVSYAACQWGVLVCLAKFGSPVIVGRFGLALAITGPVILLSQLQLRDVLVTDSKRKFIFGEYLSLRLILTAAAFVAIAGLAWVGGYAAETMLVVLAVGLGKAAESIADVFYAWFQRHERMDQIARALILQGVLALAAVGIAMALLGSLDWSAVGWAAAAGVSLGLYTLPRARRLAREEGWTSVGTEPSNGAKGGRSPGEVRRLAELAWFALPLGVVMMLISLRVSIPRYFLEAYRGEAELGIFTALAHLTAAGNMVMDALGQSTIPRLARHHAAGDGEAFRNLLLRLLGLGLIGGAAGLVLVAVAGAPVLRLLYTQEYAGHVGALGLLMAAAAISYLVSFLGDAITAARVFRIQVPLTALVTLAMAALCWLWVPRYGIEGAAWAMIVTGAVRLIASGMVVALTQRNLHGRQTA